MVSHSIISAAIIHLPLASKSINNGMNNTITNVADTISVHLLGSSLSSNDFWLVILSQSTYQYPPLCALFRFNSINSFCPLAWKFEKLNLMGNKLLQSKLKCGPNLYDKHFWQLYHCNRCGSVFGSHNVNGNHTNI